MQFCAALTHTNKKIYLWSLALSLCQEETLKAAAYVCWCVQSLVTLEQGGSINLNSLEAQLETLLESIVTFSPPGETSSPSLTLSPITWSISHHSSIRIIHPLICRDGIGAEAHGVLRPLQRCSGLAQRSRRLNRRSPRCSCHYLAGQEGEGFSYSASPHGLYSMSRISAAHDTHHGGVHHSVLQSLWAKYHFRFFVLAPTHII